MSVRCLTPIIDYRLSHVEHFNRFTGIVQPLRIVTFVVGLTADFRIVIVVGRCMDGHFDLIVILFTIPMCSV